MDLENSEPRYVISIAARIVGTETHTLRYYERLGLVQPQRSQGNVRYYSERDIEQIRHVKTLMEDLGINLAGVEVVLRMSQKIAQMQRQIEEMQSEIGKLRKASTNKKVHTKRRLIDG